MHPPVLSEVEPRVPTATVPFPPSLNQALSSIPGRPVAIVPYLAEASPFPPPSVIYRPVPPPALHRASSLCASSQY